MKNLNEVFTDEEFEHLKTVKGDRSWHDFILELAENSLACSVVPSNVKVLDTDELVVSRGFRNYLNGELRSMLKICRGEKVE